MKLTEPSAELATDALTRTVDSSSFLQFENCKMIKSDNIYLKVNLIAIQK